MDSVPHEIDIPNDHPGLLDDDNPRKRTVLIRFWKPRYSLRDPANERVHPDMDAVERLVATLSDSAELAAFLFRNTRPTCGIIAVEDLGKRPETPKPYLLHEQRERFDIPHPVDRDLDSTAGEPQIESSKQTGIEKFT
jgi:hypothetical protein